MSRIESSSSAVKAALAPIRIVENKETLDLVLTHQQQKALGALKVREGSDTSPVLRIRPGDSSGTYRIGARSIVGTVSVAGIQVSIVPKCGVENLAMLLANTTTPLRESNDSASFSDGDIVAALAQLFMDGLESITTDGLREGYSPRSETGTRPIGAVDFGWFGSGLGTPLRYTYQKYSSDIPENRLFRHTLDYLVSQLGISSAAGGRAYDLRLAFDVPEFFGDASTVARHTVIPEYVDLLMLASRILDSHGVVPVEGEQRAHGLLFNMNQVFEDFIGREIEKRAELRGFTVELQGKSRGRYLGADESVRLRPDFVVWDGAACVFVGDVKYKVRDTHTLRPDIYQMFAYAEGYSAEHVVLVHAGSGEPRSIYFSVGLGARLTSFSIDIDDEPRVIREALDACFASIVQHHRP